MFYKALVKETSPDMYLKFYISDEVLFIKYLINIYMM